ncbi:MAG: hypothetical protein ACW99G_06990 [Candidatus Thorarchaeota archaeon]
METNLSPEELVIRTHVVLVCGLKLKTSQVERSIFAKKSKVGVPAIIANKVDCERGCCPKHALRFNCGFIRTPFFYYTLDRG